MPIVVDGDGLFALAWDPDGAGRSSAGAAPTVLTPHDGEYGLARRAPPGADRIGAVRRLAADLRAVVLLKGPATVVADPDGDVLVVDAGDARLATAGTGDVLSGIIGALLATGMEPFARRRGRGVGPRRGRPARPRRRAGRQRPVDRCPRCSRTSCDATGAGRGPRSTSTRSPTTSA